MFRTVLGDVFRETLTGLGGRALALGPSLLAMLITLAVGLVVAGTVRVVVRFLLPLVGFDRFALQMGVTAVLQRAGIQSRPSNVLSLTLAWIVLILFALLAIAALDVQLAVDFVSQAFIFLPRLLIALVLLIIGVLVSAFFRRSVLLAAVNAGVPSARLLAGGVQTALMVVVVAMSLEYLGVGRQIILVSFTILFGGVVLAMALAFGLAGRELARELLQGLISRPPPESREDTFRHI
jgi:hypothetical protein